MIAFHGSQDIKDKYVARVRAHRAADEIIKGALDFGAILIDPVRGLVFSAKWGKGKPRGTRNAMGYTVFTLHFEGYRKQIKAHRAIWISIHGVPKPGLVIDHINRNKSDNRVSNLRLVSPLENSRNRRSYAGSENPSAKITKSIAAKIKTSHKETNSYSITAKQFSVSRSLVAQIVRGELWV